MATSSNKKLVIFKTVYLLLIGILIMGLLCELYFALERRSSVHRAKEYMRDSWGVYGALTTIAGNVNSLWEIEGEKYKANVLLDRTVGNGRYIVKINSHGFRTKEFEMEKPNDVYRIICIGASTTFQGKTNDDTYPTILEKKLKRRYPNLNIEVLNFGISATFSDYWLHHFNDLLRFKPDLIIQYNAVNDICWKYMAWRNNTCVNKVGYLWRRGLNLSFVLQKLFPLDPSLLDSCFVKTFQNFGGISSEAKLRGIDYIVGSFAAPDYNLASKPFKEYLDFNVQWVWGRGLNLKYYSSYYNLLCRYNKLFRSYVEQNNLSAVFVDKYISDPDLFVDICHMTQEGIEKMADAFYEGVIKIIDKKVFDNKLRK